MINPVPDDSVMLIGASDVHSNQQTGDLHGAAETWRLAQSIARDGDFKKYRKRFFCAGDFSDFEANQNIFNDHWNQHHAGDDFPTIAAVGNHDRQTGSDSTDPRGYGEASNLLDLYPEPKNHGIFPFCGNSRKTYYTIDLNKCWSMCVLDSSFFDTMKYAGNRADLRPYYVREFHRMFRLQEEWLDGEIDRFKKENRSLIVMWHHPLFCPVHGDFDHQRARDAYLLRLWQIIWDKASLLLTGHVHSYCRFKPLDADGYLSQKSNGPIWVQIGTGGGTPHHHEYNEAYEFSDPTMSEKLDKRVDVQISTVKNRDLAQFGVACIFLDNDVERRGKFRFYLADKMSFSEAEASDLFYFQGR